MYIPCEGNSDGTREDRVDWVYLSHALGVCELSLIVYPM